MPLTFAHAVAAIPLRRPFGRFGVLSALVIGSFTPDFPYFLPIVIGRDATHGLAGVFWFCLPVGLLTYVLFHRLLERPVCALMPDSLQRRCAVLRRSPRPPVWSVAVAVSLCGGALTHVVWDAFTHGGAAAVRFVPAIEQRLFTISGYTVYVFTALQHVSSVLGTAALAWWGWRWFRRAPEDHEALSRPLAPRTRFAILGTLVAVACLSSAVAVWLHPPAQLMLRALPPLVRRVLVSGVSSLILSVALYAVAWHLSRSRTSPRAL